MKTGTFYCLFFQQIIVILQSVVFRETGVSLAGRKQKHEVVMCCQDTVLYL